MAKSCNPKLSKAQDPDYVCNPETGRWIKKKKPSTAKITITTTIKKTTTKQKPAPVKTTKASCYDRLLKDLHIKVMKKSLFLEDDLVKMNPQRVKHEMVHYHSCYFHFSYIPIKDLSTQNPLWKGVKSYKELVDVILDFLALLPPLYPFPSGFHEIEQNKDLLRYLHRILFSFVQTYEQLKPASSSPLPSSAKIQSLLTHLHGRGLLQQRHTTKGGLGIHDLYDLLTQMLHGTKPSQTTMRGSWQWQIKKGLHRPTFEMKTNKWIP